MKRYRLGCIGILLCLCLFGCEATDQTKLDIYQYLQEDVTSISAQHNAAIACYNTYMAAEECDAEALTIAIRTEILPALEQVSNALSALTYQSDTVNAYVGEYEQAVGMEADALQMIVTAIEEKDEDGFTQANAVVTEAMQAMDTYQTHVRTLAAGYGLTLVDKD